MTMQKDTAIFDLIQEEENRQLNGIELIASENFTSPAVMEATGSVLTNKYAEGYPGKRYYGGCEVVDKVEQLAIDRAKELFGAAYANVQPHSGSQANTAVFHAFIKPGDKILGFDLSHGGHLTHGSPVNFSGRLYEAHFYGVQEETGRLDYANIRAIAKEVQPKMIIAGASAYSRDIDFAEFRSIADEVGAFLLADISHPSGMIATGILSNPIPHCHVVTTTTHKTLRGPRGGLILMGEDFDNPFGITLKNGTVRKMSHLLDMAVFPGNQGGPLEHVIAAKAVAFGECLQPSFKDYMQRVQKNAAAMAAAFVGMTEAVLANSASTTTQFGMIFNTIICVVVGGVLLTGGFGTVTGTILGTLTFGIVFQGINFTSFDKDLNMLFIGALLLVAVLMNDTFRNLATSASTSKKK